jgi:hypothetical protein
MIKISGQKKNLAALFLICMALCTPKTDPLFSMEKKEESEQLTLKGYTIKQDTTLSKGNDLTISGKIAFDGKGLTLTLDGGKICVSENSILLLRNITISEKGVANFEIILEDTSTLLLENVTWRINSRCFFRKGYFRVIGGKFLVENKGKKAVFIYSSEKISSVAKDAEISFNNILLLSSTIGGIVTEEGSKASLIDTFLVHKGFGGRGDVKSDGFTMSSGGSFCAKNLRDTPSTYFLVTPNPFLQKKPIKEDKSTQT